MTDKVTRQCPQITTFEEEGEPKRNRAEVPQLTSLTARPNRLTRPTHLTRPYICQESANHCLQSSVFSSQLCCFIFWSDCNQVVQSGETFTSPGYPDDLLANQTCSYTLVDVPLYSTAYVGRLVFTEFNIPADENGTCTPDTYVEVRTE